MEANKERCQVHRLPTEDGVIFKNRTTGTLVMKISNVAKKLYPAQHLYFTTDEKIKEGDWCLKPVYKGGVKVGYGILQADSSYFGGYGYDWEDHHKIIASTDPKLVFIEDYGYAKAGIPLPQPSQAFIKAYCEQGGIDEIDVEYERVSAFEQRGLPSRLKINILKVDPVHNTITTLRIVEKMYSISDIESYCEKYPNDTELGREIRKLRYKQ